MKEKGVGVGTELISLFPIPRVDVSLLLPPPVLKLRHKVPPSAYQSFLAGDDIVNVAAVVKDLATKQRVLATQEFSLSLPQISIEVLINCNLNYTQRNET